MCDPVTVDHLAALYDGLNLSDPIIIWKNFHALIDRFSHGLTYSKICLDKICPRQYFKNFVRTFEEVLQIEKIVQMA